ncbi:MAG: ROK family protein, partial [Chloroflexi bacterium]|nr:ROK family protein [Chloroflexota bacterium]
VNAFNPCLVVLGGGVVEGLPELVEMAQERVPRYSLAAAAEPLRITNAALGEHAGVIGAAALAWERFGDTEPAGDRGS